MDVVTTRTDFPKFSRVVSRDEIRRNDYNLNIPRYVDSSEKPESWDIFASMFGGIPASEVSELKEYWAAFPELKSALFADADSPYVHFSTEDIKSYVQQHKDIRHFEESFSRSFRGFDSYLNEELIQRMQTINTSKEEAVLSDIIFEKLSGIPLVNQYEAYQLLDNAWNDISVDLEIIQTEGFEATRKVDPNMVVKKKDGRDVETQDGWVGHVIPFALVQKKLLSNDLNTLREHEVRAAEITSEYEALLEELPEDEKEKDFVNEDKTAFVAAEVKETLKARDTDAEVLAVLKKYDTLSTEEKSLKKQLKAEESALHLKTKEAIESLEDAQVRELLGEKWIRPIMTGLSGLPDNIVNGFIAKLEALQKKYDTTFFEVEEEIQDTSAALSSMLDDLTGNDFDMKGLAELKKLLGGD